MLRRCIASSNRWVRRYVLCDLMQCYLFNGIIFIAKVIHLEAFSLAAQRESF
jgi:hypothetical protein